MAKYESGDIATYYFVIKDDDDHKMIRGWTDKKKLAEYYMDFHKCPKFHLKEVTKHIEEIYKILEENIHDEIAVINIWTRNRDKKRKGELRCLTIPGTNVEMIYVREECNTFFSGRVDYGYLNDAFPYLKGKYRKALSTLLLDSVILKTVHNKSNEYNSQIDMDQLIVLFKSFPDEFG